MANTSDKGALLHQPAVGHVSRSLCRAFSAKGNGPHSVSAFFTEAKLVSSNSAIILDDPVNSLDHIRRGLVAAGSRPLRRRAKLSCSRTMSLCFGSQARGKWQGCSDRRTVGNAEPRRRAKARAYSTAHPWKARMFLRAWTSFGEIRLESGRIAAHGIRKPTKTLWPSGPATCLSPGSASSAKKLSDLSSPKVAWKSVR